MSSRNNCQIFTPMNIVEEMLNNIEFNDNIFGKRVLENSFGEGNFLIEITKRYIEDGLKQKKILKKIKEAIEKNIVGIEYDIEKIDTCKNRLDEIALKYKIGNVRWNLINGDSLKIKFDYLFDFIIGNPPYITYSDLSEDDRLFIKKKYNKTCGIGKPDYYYAFIENSINSLSEKGVFTYLIPNNIFKNKFANATREFIKPFLTTIVDYGNIKLFKKKLVSSTILICKKANDTKSKIKYINKELEEEKYIKRENLSNKWRFNNNEINLQNKRFGDYFHAACSVATLLNRAFVLKKFEEKNDTIIFENFIIEKECTRIAASPRNMQFNKAEIIIFPYFYTADGLQRYEAADFEQRFPNAFSYLKSKESFLLARDSDVTAHWFEYGRSQALNHLNQDKLLISTIITKNVHVFFLEQNVIPYSGIYITNVGELTLTDAISIMKSDKFMEYVRSIGINGSGESLRISSTDVNDYMFELEV